jgi:hypothetical protein
MPIAGQYNLFSLCLQQNWLFLMLQMLKLRVPALVWNGDLLFASFREGTHS